MFWLLNKIYQIFNPPREVIDDKLKRKIKQQRAKNRETRPEVEPQPTYTIWFQDGGGRQEGLTEDQMRKQSESFSFDPEEVITTGETWIWEEGVEPYDNPSWNSEDICGGCFKTN